mmetsp:Transcript_4270/g.15682  ORF Transcript_4270/g.15682 Transcript_4270/m.15682 type:complete len:213 (-) Transcript_4270:31-669(-)
MSTILSGSVSPRRPNSSSSRPPSRRPTCMSRMDCKSTASYPWKKAGGDACGGAAGRAAGANSGPVPPRKSKFGHAWPISVSSEARRSLSRAAKPKTRAASASVATFRKTFVRRSPSSMSAAPKRAASPSTSTRAEGPASQPSKIAESTPTPPPARRSNAASAFPPSAAQPPHRQTWTVTAAPKALDARQIAKTKRRTAEYVAIAFDRGAIAK